MLELTHADPTMTRCYSGNMVKIGGDRFETNKLECANRAAASLLDTKKPCANNMGTAVQIGFKVEKWHPLVEVCHNLKESLSYYAVHKVFGSSLAGKVIQSYRPGFSRGDKAFFHGFNPDEAYNQNNQLEVFSKTFGQKKTEQYFASKKFLARGHLAPDADFLFGSWQLSTYFFVNTAPQWQAINAGHWLAVENSVRKLAINLGADLDVATGTYGVLSLTDSKRKEHEVYLVDGKRLPVPLLMWKVVRNPRDSSCMAIVATNDPFLGSPPKTICRDVCANYGWPELQSDLSKGYIYCCDFKDFKRTVNYAPDFNCKSILRFQ
ncbi:hypothetical protein AAG570_009657 [Ranatra chinensis]|uniref:Uncharacterized protein n=1 Tax=Ranatra chinensis TaxID=642074 RepID=A0ABD0Z2P9_9HEMI